MEDNELSNCKYTIEKALIYPSNLQEYNVYRVINNETHISTNMSGKEIYNLMLNENLPIPAYFEQFNPNYANIYCGKTARKK
jgi:hypothetical protein